MQVEPAAEAPIPPPNPAFDSLGHACGPTLSSAAALHVLVPTVLMVLIVILVVVKPF